ncbi:MAG: hypothetical protein ACI9DK_002387 [Vicingaceae bacterium]
MSFKSELEEKRREEKRREEKRREEKKFCNTIAEEKASDVRSFYVLYFLGLILDNDCIIIYRI